MAFLSQATSSWRLASSSRLPFRSMLLTLRGGPESLAPRAHQIPVSLMVFSTFLCRAFTAHGEDLEEWAGSREKDRLTESVGSSGYSPDRRASVHQRRHRHRFSRQQPLFLLATSVLPNARPLPGHKLPHRKATPPVTPLPTLEKPERAGVGHVKRRDWHGVAGVR